MKRKRAGRGEDRDIGDEGKGQVHQVPGADRECKDAEVPPEMGGGNWDAV